MGHAFRGLRTQQVDLADRAVRAGARNDRQPPQGRRCDLSRAQTLLESAKERLEKAGKPVRAVSIYEAGYDGFWLHRALQMAGIENRVIDAASIPVDRRARRVTTDRLDLEQLIRMLLALERGETRACRVVRVPSLTEEDAKRQHRERAVLVAELTAHGNRITRLLMLLGIRGAIRAVAISSRISRPWSPLPASRCRLIPSRL